MLCHCFQESKATAKYQTSGPDLPCPRLTFEEDSRGDLSSIFTISHSLSLASLQLSWQSNAES